MQDSQASLIHDQNRSINEQVGNILSRHRPEQDELIPILQEVQELFGYVPQETMGLIAKFVKVPDSNVFGVATFYTQFKLSPTGKNVVTVCRGTACHVRGGSRILRDIKKSWE